MVGVKHEDDVKAPRQLGAIEQHPREGRKYGEKGEKLWGYMEKGLGSGSGTYGGAGMERRKVGCSRRSLHSRVGWLAI